ncbi:hypothetical protein COOONC_22055 [Cooperia oncophora]
MTQRAYCDICNRQRSKIGARAASARPKRNAVMLACMVKLNILTMDRARYIYNDLLRSTRMYHNTVKSKKRFCGDHYTQSALYLGEMVKRRTGQDSVHGFDTVHHNIILDVLNELGLVENPFDEEIKIGPFDLTGFYNLYMSELRATENRQRNLQAIIDASEVQMQSGKPEVKAPPPNTTPSSLFLVQNVKPENVKPEVRVPPPSTTSSPLFLVVPPKVTTTAEPVTSNDLFDNSSLKTEQPEPEEVDFPETDPTLLDRFFLVRGRKLMDLFRFCPQCGQEVCKTALAAAGTAPVVHFLCAKQWEGHDLQTTQ